MSGKWIILDNATRTVLLRDLTWEENPKASPVQAFNDVLLAKGMLSRIMEREPLRDPVVVFLAARDRLKDDLSIEREVVKCQ